MHTDVDGYMHAHIRAYIKNIHMMSGYMETIQHAFIHLYIQVGAARVHSALWNFYKINPTREHFRPSPFLQRLVTQSKL